ncbi:hypothetical protein F5876DRAFT_72461 [Lentinula aff. lateritia]|uniref:Uncharacterized protein n=1 Tax=Lentinula aff. lateritia TaxID=2804960 RepID=A0ACC1UDR7_9AGAR|nr:hypothetical protein F5876DRAFT_72461 [Lentinula aff. lateritia]
MSAEPISAFNFNFWEFVCCAKCQLPFNSGANGSTVPFWLTECGHVICNNHLNSDQTCAQCRSPGIQLIPLQLDMEPPMSEWFRSVPYILDSAAYAIKFQQESMASQIRNLKVRYQQQRAYIEKLKQENAQLKQTNEMLTMQVTGMDHSLPGHEPAAFLNANGKRPMVDVSHPRSIATPVGPNRMTLPPGQQPPQLSSNQAISSNENVASQHSQRPGTNRFAQQFAYAPAQDSEMRPAQLSHTQAAPKQLRRMLQDNQTFSASQSQMPPRSHVKLNSSNSNLKPSQASNMGPPQYFRDASGHVQPTSSHLADQPPSTARFLPLSERFPPPSTPAGNSATSRRFVPPVSATRSNFRPATSSLPLNASLSRAQPKFSGSSGQRMPFVPGQ